MWENVDLGGGADELLTVLRLSCKPWRLKEVEDILMILPVMMMNNCRHIVILTIYTIYAIDTSHVADCVK